MSRTTFPSQNNSTLQKNGLATANSVNAMFSCSIIGILAFFGVAVAIGGMSAPSGPATSTQNAVALTRS